MGKLIFGGLLLFIAVILMVARSSGDQRGRPTGNLLRIFALLFSSIGAFVVLSALIIVVDPGQVGVKHAFGTVDARPLLPGIHLVAPWSSIERYSTREEQFPQAGDAAESIEALSSEQMG
ncbi:MAG: hypothetical protein SGJ01_10965, partial [Gemmatimonadota bacterium]|nr:hypothetical protein [Gemmatimonadota bacterium]